MGGVAATGFGQAASRIAEIHQAVADRSFGASGPGGQAGKAGARRHLGGGLRRGQGRRRRADARGRRRGVAAPGRRRQAALSETPAGTHALAALSGAFGDALEREASPLAVRMGVRQDGRDVPMDSQAVARAFPDATPRVARVHPRPVRVRGQLAPGGRAPLRRPGQLARLAPTRGPGFHAREDPDQHRPARFRERPPAGRAAGRSWTPAGPCPVEEVLLVGHSMGGLINRSACHYAMQGSLAVGTGACATWSRWVRHIWARQLEQAAARAGVALNWTARVPAAGPCPGPAQPGRQGPALRRAGGRGLAGAATPTCGVPTRAPTSRCLRAPRTTS